VPQGGGCRLAWLSECQRWSRYVLLLVSAGYSFSLVLTSILLSIEGELMASGREGGGVRPRANDEAGAPPQLRLLEKDSRCLFCLRIDRTHKCRLVWHLWKSPRRDIWGLTLPPPLRVRLSSSSFDSAFGCSQDPGKNRGGIQSFRA